MDTTLTHMYTDTFWQAACELKLKKFLQSIASSYTLASFPATPPPFLPIPFAFLTLHESQKKQKTPETILTQLMLAGHEVDTRWTHNLDTAGECQTTNNTLHHLFVYLTVDQGSRMFVWSKLLISNLLSSLVCRYLPFSPHVHFMSTHMINDSRPSLFFITIPLLCIIVNAREIQNGEGLEQDIHWLVVEEE